MTRYISKKICTYPDCGRMHNSKGYCSGHNHMINNGFELRPIKKRSDLKIIKICTFDGCSNKHIAKGLCSTHYNQMDKGKELTAIGIRLRNKLCSINECENSSRATGLCTKHYQASRYKPNPIIKKEKLCSVDNCDNSYKSLGFCTKHYVRFKRHGDPLVNYARNHKITKKKINNNDLTFTHSYEESMIMREYFEEAVGFDEYSE